MTEDAEILFERRGRAGLITLNRPKALNALTGSMVDLMHPKLVEWANNSAIDHVVLRASGEKAFCAGGDIRKIHEMGQASDPAILEFYHAEYRLNTFIKRYPKPYISLIDGIVMGGGVGLSFHGSHRVASERIMFAMPETGIGFFPDVGGTWLLPRLPGNVGVWLALSGARLKRADAVWCGLATHAAPSADMTKIADALAEGDEGVDDILMRHASAGEGASLPALMPVIERCFAPDSVEAILERLDGETGTDREWAAKQAATLREKSPTSLKIALRQMQEGKSADFEDGMRMEFRIVSRIVEGHDFFEGVRAVIIDKDHAPKWKPDSLEDVSKADIDAYFAPVDVELDLAGLDAA